MVRLRLQVGAIAVCVAMMVGVVSTEGQVAVTDIGLDSQTEVGTTFTFQGGLSDSHGPVNSACDFRFSLFDAAMSGHQIGTTIWYPELVLTDGLFAAELDFGQVFTGDARWIEVGVRCPGGSGAYVTLLPREKVGPSPYAMMANRVVNVEEAGSDFTAYGILKSARGLPEDKSAGALQLENTITTNKWHICIDRDDDALVFGFLETGSPWSHAATLDRDGGLVLAGDLSINGVVTSDLSAQGVLRSSRGLPQDRSAGALELENTLSNNKWHIATQRDDDTLSIGFMDSTSTWSGAATLDRYGNAQLNGKLHVVGDSVVFLDAAVPSGLLWHGTEAAVGRASSAGEFSLDSQAGDLVVRADSGRQIILGRGSSPDHAAALTVESSGLVSIPNLEGGSFVEANLQTPSEQASEGIQRFSLGDVLCWDGAGEHLMRCIENASPMVVAVADAHGKPVILGVEPVRALGPVWPGDLLVASETPGCAVAWSRDHTGYPPPGVVVAKALGSLDAGQGLVKAMILPR